MTARKPKDQAQDSKRCSESRAPYTNLDTRYGRIGISAVAAAVRCKGETGKKPAAANTNKARHYESD